MKGGEGGQTVESGKDPMFNQDEASALLTRIRYVPYPYQTLFRLFFLLRTQR